MYVKIFRRKYELIFLSSKIKFIIEKSLHGKIKCWLIEYAGGTNQTKLL